MRTKKRGKRHIISILLAVSIIFMMVLPATAEEDSTLTAAEDPRESIMTLSLGIQDDNGKYTPVTFGTCFLVNDEYVLTNYHVIAASEEFLKIVKENMGLDLKANDGHIKRYVHISRDIKVEATIHGNVQSEVMDFALVKLNEKVYDRKPLSLGDSDSVEIKDAVYAMGFPGDSVTTREYFTKDDVSVTDGTISKITNSGSEDLFEHTAILNHGNSGGPLMDTNNNVVGVNSSGMQTKNYAVRINFIKKTMDTFGVPYINAGTDPSPQPDIIGDEKDGEENKEETVDNSAILAELQTVIEEAKDIDTAIYTEESVSALNDSIGTAEAVIKNTEASAAEIQSATDDLNQAITDLEEKSGPNLILILGIAVTAVIIIIIIVVIIISGKRKKPALSGHNTPPAGFVPPTGGGMMTNQGMPSGAAPTSMPHSMAAPEGAGETTILDAGAGETTLLSGGGSGRSAYLIRKKNGEKIAINLSNFKIGKERKRVNYCISDNTSVSRVHCEIVKKGSDYYVVDQGATNFTFVNGIQLSRYQETLLSDQSILKLSDEEFEFHLS